MASLITYPQSDPAYCGRRPEILGIWLKKKTWAVIDACSLLWGCVPDEFGDEETDAGHFFDNNNGNEGARNVLTYLKNLTKITEPIESRWVLDLCGGLTTLVRYDNCLYDDDFLMARFPVGAYYLASIFIAKAEGVDIPCFGLFHDRAREAKKLKELTPFDDSADGVFFLSNGLPGSLKDVPTVKGWISQVDPDYAYTLPDSADHNDAFAYLRKAPKNKDIQASFSAKVPEGEIEIFDGVTVDDVRKIAESAPQLPFILSVVNEYRKDYADAVTSNLGRKPDLDLMLRNSHKKGKWGRSNQEGELVNADIEAVRRVFTRDFCNKGGRPSLKK